MDLTTIEFQGVDAGDFRLDASSITVPKEDADKGKALVQNLYDAAEVIETLRGEIETLEGEKAILKEGQEVPPERLDSLVRERKELECVAAASGLKEDDLKDMPNGEVVRAVVQTRTKLKEDASQEYVQGAYNMIADSLKADEDKTDRAKKAFGDLADNTSGRQRLDADGRPDPAFRDDGEEKSYREIHMDKMNGVHDMNSEELAAAGFR